MTGPALRVATYNVHGCVGSDGRRDVARVAEVIRSLDADVVGLQEIDTRRSPGQLAELADRTGLTAVAGPTIRTEHGFYGNALLTRRSHASVGHVDISLPRFEPRRVLDVRLELKRGPLRVLITHFGLSSRERRHQTDAVAKLVGESGPVPVVLMGDFNEWRPRGYTLHRLHAMLGRAPRARSFPARFPLLALDRIWVRPRAALVELSAHQGAPARRASDHLPIVARIDPARLGARGSSPPASVPKDHEKGEP